MIASTQTNHPLVGPARSDSRRPTPVETAAERLRAAGLRITQPRLAILAALNKRVQPVTIEQLHAEVGAEQCDLVTVYRCMAAFEEIGLVRRAFFHNGTALYVLHLDETARYHVVCKATDRVEELDAETTEELRRAIETAQAKLRARGYTGVGHIVEFFGTAPDAVATRAAAAVAVPEVR